MKEKEKKHNLIRTRKQQQKSRRRNKQPGSLSWKILRTLLKMDLGGTQTNRPEDKKVDDNTQGLKPEI